MRGGAQRDMAGEAAGMGVELDDLIAEKVMGWKRKWVLSQNPHDFYGSHFDSKLECATYQREYGISRIFRPTLAWVNGRQIVMPRGLWAPSTDVGMAMRGVEYIQGLPGVRLDFGLRSRGEWKAHPEKWIAWFNRTGESWFGGWEGLGETASLAVCRVLLKLAGAGFLTEG